MFDQYSLKARVYPTIIALLPFALVSFSYVSKLEQYWHYGSTVIGLGVLSFLFSQLGRDIGKRKEKELFEYFGGPPTTQLLRHESDYLSPYIKRKYFGILNRLVPNISIPSVEQEQGDPKEADEIYSACVRYVINATRDSSKFPLVLKENVNYGFRRNLWAMKFWGVLFTLLCLSFEAYVLVIYIQSGYDLSVIDLIATLLLAINLCLWLFAYTRTWVRVPAFAYAERLLECLDTLE